MVTARFIPLAALLLAGPAALAAVDGPMSVSFLRGEATVRQHEGAPSPLEEGSVLHEGDQVETGPAARMEILLGTGSIVRLGQRSRLELKAASSDATSFRARLTLGNLWAKVQKLLTGQRFQVETENGVAGVRGTEFRVSATARGQGMVRVYEGAVQVEALDGKWQHLVKPGGEIRYSKSATLGPRTFDSKAERSSFMRWVRRKGPLAGPERHDKVDPKKDRVHERLKDLKKKPQ